MHNFLILSLVNSAYLFGTALLISFVAFRSYPPGRRGFLTAALAWVVWAAIVLIGSGLRALPVAALLLPAAAIVWVLLWLFFRRFWAEDTD